MNDKYAPAWKTLEFFSFGIILKIFKNLKNGEIKERISKNFGVLNVNKFTNFIDTLIVLTVMFYLISKHLWEYPLFQKLIITIGIDIL